MIKIILHILKYGLFAFAILVAGQIKWQGKRISDHVENRFSYRTIEKLLGEISLRVSMIQDSKMARISGIQKESPSNTMSDTRASEAKDDLSDSDKKDLKRLF